MTINCSILHPTIWLILSGAFGIVACSPPTISTTQTFQTPMSTIVVMRTLPPTPPTSALELAENYVIGSSQIPADMYLFIEVSIYDECPHGFCGCPVVEPPPPAYRWTTSNELCVYPDFYPSNIVIDPTSASSSSVLGLFGSGQWQQRVDTIDILPYDAMGTTIYGVDSEGRIVIDVQGKSYFLQPGQSWVTGSTYISPYEPGCNLHREERLTNHGLLKRLSLKVCKW